MIDIGLGFVPEDRKHDGFVGSFSVAENLVLNHFDEPPYAKGIALDLGRIRANAEERVAEFDIRTQSVEAPVSALSGGNQQKVVLARELSRPLSALIANQPTRGVDVGAIEFVHKRLVAERDRGTAVLIVSTELDEVVALADRIAVMYRGKIVGIVPAGHLPGGAWPDDGRRADRGGPGQCVGDHPGRGGRRVGGIAGRIHLVSTATAPPEPVEGPASTDSASRPRKRRSFPWTDVVTTLAAFVLAFLVGALLMIFSDTEVRWTFTYFFARPGDALTASWEKVSTAYAALITGAVGGYGPITETTAQAAPLICAGLGVGLAFRAGLFNIGAQGQAIVGAILAAYVGFTLNLPPVIHLLVAVLGGMIGGGIWGGIVGWLKARTGAHEVIVTIMMNYIATGLLAYLLTTTAFQRPGRADPISPIVDWNATFPEAAGRPAALRLRAGSAGRGRGLVAAGPLDHRFRHPRGRGQPARGGDRRDERCPDHGDHHGGWPARWPAWPEYRPRWARPPPEFRCRCRRASSGRSASTRSPWPCSAGPSHWASSWPVCCSAACTPAAWPCRASPRRR